MQIKSSMTPKFHSLKINDVRTETEDTVSISFTVPSDLRNDYTFESGQYLTLKADINNEDVRRSYSLCSSPYENEWRVAVKQVPNGKFSTYANNTLDKGMVLDVMTPTGNFKLSTDSSKANSYVLFAAGSGITPMLSIAKSALHDEPNSDVTLFYGNKGFASIIFREEIEALKNQYMGRLRIIHILSRESLGNVIQKGRIDKEKTTQLFDAFLKDIDISGVYICGPESMITGVKEALIEKGVESSSIHFELFTAPSTENKPVESNVNLDKVESNVSVIIDGEQIDLNLDSSGENILDAAQKAGGDLPYACKGGVCCTCKAKILEGSARMDVNYALEEDEVEAGYILTCQSHPTSKKLVVSFDD
jgi:ring-1,2-phenylacetyl-CoA epoxidase subunit PaaE